MTDIKTEKISWDSELKCLHICCDKLTHDAFLTKELNILFKTKDVHVFTSTRRILEVIITKICETKLKRPRGTESLKGILDKLMKDKVVPEHVVLSMYCVNGLGTLGAHPKDFSPKQIKVAILSLTIVLDWWLESSVINKNAEVFVDVVPKDIIVANKISIVNKNAKVFVHAEPKDIAIANKIGNYLKIHDIQFNLTRNISPTIEGNEVRKNLEENLLNCSAAIIVYGDAPKSWIDEQLRQCQRTCSSRHPIKLIVYKKQSNPPLNDVGLLKLLILKCTSQHAPETCPEFINTVEMLKEIS